MIYWKGKTYRKVALPYNGVALGYLLDGLLITSPPKGTKVTGHIVTDEGVIIILGREMRFIIAIVLIAVAAVTIVLWPRYEYSYYQVTFSEHPVMRDSTLYCNVVNEADRTVTVQFLSHESKTTIYTLEPGETLPYIYVDFTPDVIRYNGKSDFPLEVQND